MTFNPGVNIAVIYFHGDLIHLGTCISTE